MFAESHRVWCRYAFHVLLISLCLGPSILFVQAQDIRPDEEIAFGKPTYHNGPYAIWNCNSTEGPKMVNLLHKIGRLLEGVVIPNASVASRNPVPAYGFHAMMGKSTTGEYVADRFSKACRGETESHGFQRDVVPRFVCLHEPGLAEPPELMDDEEHYSRNPFQGNPGLRYLNQSPFMSNFFDDRYWRDLPRKEDCPEVAEDGRSFKSNYTSILDNRFGYIVGDIMRDFLPQYLSWTDPNGINDRITWWDGRKRNSDKNFAYYASFVVAGCTSFPEDFETMETPSWAEHY